VTLPEGWVSAKASDVCDVVQSGGTPKDGFVDQPGIPFLKVFNIVGDKVDFNYRPQFILRDVHEGELRKSRTYPGDVLMNIVGPPLGKIAVVPDDFPEWNVNQALTIFRPSAAVRSRWLYQFLRGGHSVQSVINETKGIVGQVNISLSQCRDFEFPLPPLAEQRRIVAKLDALTTRLARARAELERVQVLARDLRQKALEACFDQVDAVAEELGSLLHAIEAGKNMRCEERPPATGELGVVKVSAVTWGRFDPSQSKTLPPDYRPPEKARIHAGDLLISRANTLELVGAVALVEAEPDGLFLSDKILRLVVDENVKQWVLWFLRSASGRRQIERLATGNQLSMRNISQEALRRILLPVPAPEVRARLIGKLDAALVRADRLEAEAARARALLDRLEGSLLAKAFRGELVAQDPNDEPAGVLLQRICAQHACGAKARRRGRSNNLTGGRTIRQPPEHNAAPAGPRPGKE
jgi:type I restriction enzyme S subunit